MEIDVSFYNIAHLGGQGGGRFTGWVALYIRNEKCALHVYPYNAMHLPFTSYSVQLPNEPQVTEHLHYQYFDRFSR